MKKSPLRPLAAALVITLSPFGSSAFAAAVSFDNGAGDFSWFSGSNWSNNVVPTTADTVTINAPSTLANPVLINAAGATAQSLTLGTNNGDSGFLSVGASGVFAQTAGDTSTQIIGNNGAGTLTQIGGSSITFQRGFNLGQLATGNGTWNQTGGTVTTGNFASIIGDAGRGLYLQTGGTANLQGITVGSAVASSGTYSLTGPGILNVGTNRIATIGSSGTGAFLISSGTVNSGGTNGTIVVRANAAGTGTIQGNGTFFYTSDQGVVLLTNNGKVIADGDGISNTTLLFRSSGFSNQTQQLTANTIENTTDNGYYAQNKGQITLGRVSAGLNGLGAKVMTFGESVGDTTIDLVNSTRYTFTANSTNLTADLSLLSDDRTGLVAAPTNVDFVGVWNLTLTGGSFTAFSAPTYNFRYDDIAAGGDAVSLYRLNGGVWDLQTFSVDAANNILSTSDTSITTLNNTFAIGYVIPEPSSLALLVGAGMLVALRRRRASRA